MSDGSASLRANWLQRRPGLRRRLVALVLACIVPLLLFAAALAYGFAEVRREALQSRVQDTAHSLALLVDQEIGQAQALLTGLATSPLLDDGRLEAFYAQAKRLAPGGERWIILFNRDRDQLLNTARPLGFPLPKGVNAPAVVDVLRTGTPAVTGLLTGAVVGEPVVGTAVPVVRDGTLTYVLSLSFSPIIFSEILRARELPDGWTVAVLDQAGTILARNRAPERHVGQKGVPDLVEAIQAGKEGEIAIPTREGVLNYGFTKRAPTSGWTVIVGAPLSTLEAPLYRSLALLLGGGSLVLFLALALASASARSIARPVRQLAQAAAALGRGDPPEPPTPGIREVDDVGRVLVETATLLRQRQRERQRAEAALRESEGRLRRAHQASGISDWDWEPSAGLMRWSHRRGKPITDEAIVDPQAEIFMARVHPDDRVRIAAQAIDLAEGRRTGMDTELRIVDPDGSIRWLAARGDVERDADGRIARIIGVSFDITERKRAEQALRDSELRYRTLFEQAAVGVAHVGADGRLLLVNQRFCDLLGHVREELVGTDLQALMHPDELETAAKQMRELLEGRADSASRETRYRRKDGSYLWAASSVSLAGGAGERPYRIVVIQDVSERKDAERRQRLLIDELNHRVKNTLAAVQSMVMQSIRAADDPKAFARTLQARLMALSTTHDLLTRRVWEGALLGEVAREALAPFGDPDNPARIRVAGPAVHLAPNAAIALSMAFHELAMNALKHGALSTPEGRVVLDWALESRTDDATVLLQWRESGGPAVVPPARRGLGSRLIERGLAHELQAEVSMEFATAGLRCRIRLPLSQMVMAA